MSKKLLLADDSITIQKVIQITFAHEDYELTITDNGDAALAKAQEIKPDLVMTDIYMPGKNGYELTAAIKQDPVLQNVPVLLLAGSFEPFDEDKARSCKADAWIEKPFESQSLIDKVAELLLAAREVPVAAVEPEPFAAVEPVAAAEEAVELTPLAAFDEPVSSAVEMDEVSDDPFGDISFEEEVPVVQPAPVSIADDWSDVVAEPVVEEPVVEEPVVEEPVVEEPLAEEPLAEEPLAEEPLAEEPLAEEPLAETGFATAEQSVEDFNFIEETSFSDTSEDFTFTEEEPVAADVFSAAQELPVAEVDLDVFEMGEDEIMPLDDDDILGAEDLDPTMPEHTLAAWSRSETEAEDVFAEPLEESPAFESDAAFVTPVDEPVFAAEELFVGDAEPISEVTSAFEESVAVSAPVEEFVPVAEEPEPAVVAAAMVDIEAKASSMSEDEVEKIIEKIVTQVVEKLAGSILERVAWDVVPDLAENLIREEIRKIKDAAV